MSLEDAEVAGITESFAILLGNLGVSDVVIRAVVIVAGLMFIYTMVANIVSWSFGVNSVAKFQLMMEDFQKYSLKPIKKAYHIWHHI